jgi:hypothetical protein
LPFHLDEELNLIVCNDFTVTNYFLDALQDVKRDQSVVDTFLVLASQKQDEVSRQIDFEAELARVSRLKRALEKSKSEIQNEEEVDLANINI